MRLKTKPGQQRRDQAAAVRNSDRRRRYDARIRSAEFAVQIGEPSDPARRRRCCKSLERFLRTYFRHEFRHAFDPNMKKVIAVTEQTIIDGGRFATIMPRGSGKTVVLCRSTLWGALTGRRPFLVLLAATEPAAARLLQMLHVDLSSNELLRADFPEVCAPFHAGEGKPQRIRALHADGEQLHANATRDRVVFPMLDRRGSNANGQIIVCRGLTGALRGVTHTRPDGVTIRPSCVLVDDPQTDDSARSPQQTAERESLLSGAVLGLAGPRENVACLVALTCIRRHDLAGRLLDPQAHPEFTARRFPLVESWPASELWQEYAARWKGQGPKAATAFYRSHRTAMDDGAVVACTWRIRPGELSAVQTAFTLRIEMGDAAFAAEMQGEPLEKNATAYDLTPEEIVAHTIDLPQLHIPAAATVIGGHCDINRSGLHWCLAAFDQKMTAHVAAYGCHPGKGDLWQENASEHARQVAIFAGLKALFDAIAATPLSRDGVPAAPGLFLVDAGFDADIVHRFCEASRYPFRVIPSIGRAAHKYRWSSATLIGQPAEHCHIQRPANRRCPYAMHNADYWREVAQRAFLGAPGEPGGCTLHAAPSVKAHMPLAQHITAERLIGKYQTEVGVRWEWAPQPGSPNDWLDALTGSWVAAALQGLTTAGQPRQPARSKRRAPRVTRVRF